MANFEWTAGATDAAQMIADGDLSYEAIARSVNCAPNTLLKWRAHPEFQAKVEEHRRDYREHVRRRGIAIREKRIASLNSRHDLMMQVIAERAADPRMAEIAGGTTGLVVITDWKRLPKDESKPKVLDDAGMEKESPLVAVVEFDAALVKALSDHEKQAAQDLGEWTNKTEVTGANGGAVGITVIEIVQPPADPIAD